MVEKRKRAELRKLLRSHGCDAAESGQWRLVHIHERPADDGSVERFALDLYAGDQHLDTMLFVTERLREMVTEILPRTCFEEAIREGKHLHRRRSDRGSSSFFALDLFEAARVTKRMTPRASGSAGSRSRIRQSRHVMTYHFPSEASREFKVRELAERDAARAKAATAA